MAAGDRERASVARLVERQGTARSHGTLDHGVPAGAPPAARPRLAQRDAASWTTTLRSRVPASRARGQPLVPAVTAVLVLGPALGRGVVLAYDLAWSPDPRLTPFALGTSTPAPRAVPSDAAAVVLGWVLGAGPAQALVLWGTLVLAGVGAARLAALLAPDVGLLGRSAAALAAVWNPFVLERLVVGQWTVLLGYAAVPHLLVTAVRVRRGLAPPWSPAVGLAACGLGGANTLVIGSLAVGRGARRPATPVAGARARHGIRPRRLGRVGAAGGRPPGSSRRPSGWPRSPPGPTPPSASSGRSSAVAASGTRPPTRPAGRSLVVALAAAALALGLRRRRGPRGPPRAPRGASSCRPCSGSGSPG